LPSRRAQTDSEVAHLEINRLIPERLGGKISGGGGQVRDTAVVGFKQRDPGSRGEIARIRGGSQETESAVERGLAFLARHQSPDGSWSLHDWNAGHEYPDAAPGTIQSNAGATGLVLLTFLGAGYTHDQGKYREHIARGLDWLIAHQKPDGDLFIPQSARSTQNVWLYSHGGAAAALCEAYGMTRDERLREPAAGNTRRSGEAIRRFPNGK
jgi:hypothetical protein